MLGVEDRSGLVCSEARYASPPSMFKIRTMPVVDQAKQPSCIIRNANMPMIVTMLTIKANRIT